jgi:translation initiation factor 3 subunit B
VPLSNIGCSADLKEQYEVKLEEGLDTFVVIDGLPVVPEDSRQKLVKFLLRKLNTVGRTSEDAVFMPLNDKGMSEGCVQDEWATNLCGVDQMVD